MYKETLAYTWGNHCQYSVKTTETTNKKHHVGRVLTGVLHATFGTHEPEECICS